MTKKTTHFGFKEVAVEEKARHVAKVFSSVAPKYDVMNDLMSLGLHRLWKKITIDYAHVRPGMKILDLAGGTGDLTAAFCKQLKGNGQIILADINAAMLNVGRDKLLDQGLIHNIDFVQANAENLPFSDNYFDCITIAFGLRNVTDKDRALRSMFRVLKPGGQLLILEFSKIQNKALEPIYDAYSFKILPKLGEWVANDAASYQYLAESIRRHPDQQTLLNMLAEAGFEKTTVHNFMLGVVALHRGYKLC